MSNQKYVMVPVEPTPEWVANLRKIRIDRMESVIEDVLAAAPAEQGEPVAWSGWGCQYPGKMPRLYGDRRIAELNCDRENGDQLLHFTAAPHPAEQATAPHPDDAAVDRFAVAMKDKLAASRKKGRYGWQNATAPYLSALLYDHLYKADPLDVGNFAMMLHQNGQAIELPEPDVTQLVEALEECAASLAWNCFGECRAIHAGPIMPAAQALETAREALAIHSKRGKSDE